MTVDLAISLLIALANNAGRISQAVTKAREEGRTEFTEEEWMAIVSDDEAARIKQQAALDRAKAEGR